MSCVACILKDSSTLVYGAKKRCSRMIDGMSRERKVSDLHRHFFDIMTYENLVKQTLT